MPTKISAVYIMLVAFYIGLLSSCENKSNVFIKLHPPSKRNIAPTRCATLYQDEEYEVVGLAQHYATIIRVGSPARLWPQGIDTLFHNEDISVLGDTALRGTSFLVYRTFTYHHTFSQFPIAPSTHRRSVAVNFASNPAAKRHVTRIRQGARQPANFAGHYSLITWGCGSTCQQSVLVDQRTGHIYDVPETAQGLSYRLNSRLLITDYIEDGEASYPVNSAYPNPAFYLWTGSRFRKLE